MKKRVIAIVVMVVLVMSMVACGSTQAQPVQESTPATKTETAAESAEETKEETPAEEHTHPSADELMEAAMAETEKSSVVIDGIDFSSAKQHSYEQIISEQAKYDTLKVFVVRDVYGEYEIETVLSDGDSLICDDAGTYQFIFYTPRTINKAVQESERNMDGGFVTDFTTHENVAAYGFLTKQCDNIPVGITVRYEDGTEESITIYVTKTK